MLEPRIPVAYRAVLLAGVLLVLGMLFRQLATLLLAVLMTVIIAIPLSAGAAKLRRPGVAGPGGGPPAPPLGGGGVGRLLAPVIPPFVPQSNQFGGPRDAAAGSRRAGRHPGTDHPHVRPRDQPVGGPGAGHRHGPREDGRKRHR